MHFRNSAWKHIMEEKQEAKFLLWAKRKRRKERETGIGKEERQKERYKKKNWKTKTYQNKI